MDTTYPRKEKEIKIKGPALDFIEREATASGANTSAFVERIFDFYAGVEQFQNPDGTITIRTTDGKLVKFTLPSRQVAPRQE
jgi:hypothetical protein